MEVIETNESEIRMKKKILATALAMLLAMPLLAGCSEQDPNAPSGYQLASDDCVEYHLFVPNDWIVDTADNSMMSTARVSDVIAANISMIAFTNDSYEVKNDENGKLLSPVPDYWKDYQKDVEKIFDLDKEGKTTYKLSKDLSGKTTLIGANNQTGKTATGYTYVYTGTVGGKDLQYMQVIIYQKETFYLFTYTAAPSQYEEYAEEVEEILSYIELP